MSTQLSKNGSCLCGSVKFTATITDPGLGACHCGMCQKWGSGAYMAVNVENNVSFQGEENISNYSSSDWAERGFCSKCGTHLYYKLKETKQHIMSLGVFDNQEGLIFDHQIFIDRKSDLYSFEQKTKNMTEKVVFEKYFN